jgi:hypothetical protein
MAREGNKIEQSGFEGGDKAGIKGRDVMGGAKAAGGEDVVLKRDIGEDEIHWIGQRMRKGLIQQARDPLSAGSCNLDCMPYSTSDSRSA